MQMFADLAMIINNNKFVSSDSLRAWRQRGREVRASDLKSVGRGFKSRSDH